jgi:vacuolar-type H+-ATPase subunit H
LSSPDIMKKIVEAEMESRHIVDEAKREIAEMKKKLPIRITLMRQEILQQATAQREKMLVEAETAGAEDAERVASDVQRQIEALSQISAAKRRQAVESAIALLVS